MIRTLLATLLLLSAPALAAQEVRAPAIVAAAVAPAASAPAPAFRTTRVRLTTAEGPILIAVETERAPLTAANFLRYVDRRKLDGASFYRALGFPGRPDLGLVQGGAKSDPERLLPPIPHEPTSKTGLTHGDGAISMARGAPGSAQGDFFIILGGLPALDASPPVPGQAAGADSGGFAVFGHVVEGMDVVKRILAAPVSPTAGAGAMKGQMILKPVPILSARRAD